MQIVWKLLKGTQTVAIVNLQKDVHKLKEKFVEQTLFPQDLELPMRGFHVGGKANSFQLFDLLFTWMSNVINLSKPSCLD